MIETSNDWKRRMVIDKGTKPFSEIYVLQKKLVALRAQGVIQDTVIFVEHTPVITVGRTGSAGQLLTDSHGLRSRRIEYVETDRGGGATFHGPGQLVIYPIIDLAHLRKDLHWYMRCLEQSAIEMLSEFDIHALTIRGLTGVWVAGEKVASIGIAASRWVTYHGMSINVNVDLGYFDLIQPCGIPDVRMTSMCAILGRPVPLQEVKRHFIRCFEHVFKNGESLRYEIEPVSVGCLNDGPAI